MAFCSECGAKLSDNQKFCAECGNPISAPAPTNEGKTTYVPFAENGPMERTTYLPRKGNGAYDAPRQPQEPERWVYEQPPVKKKKGKGGLIAAIILVLLLIGGAAAFFFLGGLDLIGGDKKPAGNEEVLGVYGAMQCIYDGKEQDVSDEWLELKADGKGKLLLEGEKFSFQWELDDEELLIIQQGDKYEGTLEDDVILIDINGMEYTYILEDSEAEAQWLEDREKDKTPAPTEAPAAPKAPVIEAPAMAADPSTLEYWEGDWYGWWIVNTVYEGDASNEASWWDCCASLDIDKYGNATMVIWDEDGSRSETLGEIYLNVSIVDTGVAEFRATGGYFGGFSINTDDWFCCSNDDEEYDQTFWISGTYNDGEGLHFDYTFYMRPWGLEWNDVEATNPDLLPGYYNWYFRQITAGVTTAPDRIG